MSVTILEALQNANYNIQAGYLFAMGIAKSQLNNAVVLLEKGYDIKEDVEPLLEQYGDVDSVPDKE
jgi:hypothetical protein